MILAFNIFFWASSSCNSLLLLKTILFTRAAAGLWLQLGVFWFALLFTVACEIFDIERVLAVLGA